MKYIIRWDFGQGEDFKLIEAESEELAERQAYLEWQRHAEDNADYGALELTPQVAEDYDINERG